jgi:hypothetical protein
MKEYAQSQDLKTIAGAWGLANVFGEEAISTVNYRRDGLKKESILNIGFDNVFLDEPHAGSETLKFIPRIYEIKGLLIFTFAFVTIYSIGLTNDDNH